MPRTARASAGGVCYHVLNRGNGRSRVFRSDQDFGAFVRLIADAVDRLPMRVVAYCLMPNHLHLVLWPHADGDLGRFMHWLMTAHVRRHHQVHGTSGHVWGGRFKAFPIQDDDHLLTVVRYVERNPVRAKLVRHAESWRWSSLSPVGPNEKRPELDGTLVDRRKNWRQWVNKPITDEEQQAVSRSLARGAPYGDPRWAKSTASRLGLQSTLRPRGRPRKSSTTAEEK